MIHLIDNYYVQVEEKNYVLVKKTGTKNKHGEDNFKTLAYTGTMKSTINILHKELVRDGLKDKNMELKEALEVIRQQTDRIEKLMVEDV